ncbi:MAG TPA: class I adenylate-forming enzyme family protein [Pelagibacterium sp.]|uniref:class I adenylate-forming enzyme family protein n=1 Tax=Pelagibacterium sp. TaxID=1967288 RepID=UPI002B97418F|nr:class I adenylate-forming enzyme family protein [Pelagibacterium sp.]HWJ87749.1 class I adenylate-forming enzyme family protein [Pelagibacterium sp.]
MRIEHYLTQSAKRWPDKTALVAGPVRLTYAELDHRASALAGALAQTGIGCGDRVLVFLDNSWEAAIAIFGILKAGAAFSPINAATKAQKLAYMIDHSRPRAVITRTRMAQTLASAMDQARHRPMAIVAGDASPVLSDALAFSAMIEGSGDLPDHGGTADDLAMLIYTSGSTGQPKGVMMTHANMDAAARSVMGYLNNDAEDVLLSVLPLAHSYGLYQLITAMMAGATLVLEKSFAFPRVILDTLRTERVTGLPIVPSMAALMLDQIDPERDVFPDLRYTTTASAALPPSHLARLRTVFPNAALYSMYGQTECKRATYLPPERLADKPDSVGIAIPGTDVYVADDNGQTLPAGMTGELMVRGPHVMQGYWEDPEATAHALRPGSRPGEKVLATGDLFYADSEGFLYFVARKDDIIKTRGEKVAPREVEAALLSHPAIAEAIVIGRDDAVLGQAICALVVSRDPELTEKDVVRHCARLLEDFMVPKTVIFRQTLPKTDTGKLSRKLAAESLV